MWSVTLLTPYRDENVEDTMSRIYRKVRYEFNIAVKKRYLVTTVERDVWECAIMSIVEICKLMKIRCNFK